MYRKCFIILNKLLFTPPGSVFWLRSKPLSIHNVSEFSIKFLSIIRWSETSFPLILHSTSIDKKGGTAMSRATLIIQLRHCNNSTPNEHDLTFFGKFAQWTPKTALLFYSTVYAITATQLLTSSSGTINHNILFFLPSNPKEVNKFWNPSTYPRRNLIRSYLLIIIKSAHGLLPPCMY